MATVATSAKKTSTTSQFARAATVILPVSTVPSRVAVACQLASCVSAKNASREEFVISVRNSTGIFSQTTLMDAKVKFCLILVHL